MSPGLSVACCPFWRIVQVPSSWKPGRLGLDADQFARAADPLGVGFDMHEIEAWHMRKRNWLGMDGARIGMLIAKRGGLDARNGVANNFAPKVEALTSRHARCRQQARDLPTFGQQGIFAVPCRGWQRSHGGPR
jgi:hypothetical protein